MLRTSALGAVAAVALGALALSQRGAHGPGGTPSGQSYAVAPVAHPGRISGAVRWQGAVPTLPALEVPPAIASAQRACGTSSPSQALAVGPGGGVRYTVLYVDGVAQGAPLRTTPVELDNHGCVFAPHVVATSVGGTLRLGNRDPGVLHNVHAFATLQGEETLFNLATPPGMTLGRAVAREGIHRLVCDAGHPWMLAYAHVFPHPYFAVTDEQGRFAIEQLPPGTYRLRAWHEGWSQAGTDARHRAQWSAPVEAELRVTVPSDGAVTVEGTLGPTAALSLRVGR